MNVIGLIDYCEKHAPPGCEQDSQDFQHSRNHAEKLRCLFLSWRKRCMIQIRPYDGKVSVVFQSSRDVGTDELKGYLDFMLSVERWIADNK